MLFEAKGSNVDENMFSKGEPKHVTHREFLRRIARELSIARIYYPGSCHDRQLEKPFGKKVVTLDKDMETGMPNFVQGRMENSPFLSEVFDAVFLQDVGANEGELTDVLRTLRPNGIVIHSYSDCCDEDLPLLEDHPQLMFLEFPYYHEDLSIFRKLEAPTQNQK